MRVTIIADASRCPTTGASGYGYWIASERGKKGGGGPIREMTDGSLAAEMMALVNGFHFAIKFGLVQERDHILLQTDCLGAIDAFESRKLTLSKDERKAKKKFYKMKIALRVTVSFRHVKGHTKRREARFVTNNLCDKRAKNGMRLMRQRFMKEMGIEE